MKTLKLSAVTMVDSQRERGALALQALSGQSLIDEMEILLLDFGTMDQPPVRGSEHPCVRVIRADKNVGHGEALAMAVGLASAPIVAFVEEHVVVLDGWAQALVAAYEGPWAAVGSEMHPGDLGRPVAKRIELVSRHHWSAPALRGESTGLRWQNTSYRREALLRYGERLPLLLTSESMLYQQLRRDGERLFVECEARMVHAHENDWHDFVGASFHSARASAAAAAELRGGGARSRLQETARHLLGAVRWPFVLWRRTRSLPNSEEWLPVFYTNFFYVLEYYGAHAVAGALGALGGRGDSHRQFLSYEVNVDRHKPVVPPQP